MENQRSLLLFEQALKTEATKKTYKYQLSVFLKFYHIKDFDSLLKIDNSKLQEMLEDYLFHIKKEKSPATVQTAFYAIELFFSMNDVVLNFKKLRKMFPPLEKKTGMKAYTTEDIQKMLVTCTTRKQRAMILVLSSSGMRVGGLAELKMKHISEMPHDCRAITVYPDSRDEYITFITPETCATLDDYFDERKKKVLIPYRHHIPSSRRLTPYTDITMLHTTLDEEFCSVPS